MNEIYIAAILTPVLHSLVVKAITPWYRDPEMTPMGLLSLGLLGKLYHMAIMLVSIAAPVSMLGLMFFGNTPFLSTLGALILGYLSAGVLLAMCSRVFVASLLVDNLISPGLFAANLVAVHVLAWHSS